MYLDAAHDAVMIVTAVPRRVAACEDLSTGLTIHVDIDRFERLSDQKRWHETRSCHCV
jgi:hypothetical protein